MPSHSPLYDITAQALAPIAPRLPQTLLRWQTGITPLSDVTSVTAAIVTYLVTIFSLRALMRHLKAGKQQRQQASTANGNGKANGQNKAQVESPVLLGGKPAREAPLIPSSTLKLPFLVHNVALAFGSGWLLALMLEEIMPIMARNGTFYSICSPGAWTMRMETFYIVNYYFKYWELLDTIFMVLKEKPLTFLHVYHHSATALLCYSQLEGKTSVSWVVICLNLLVHVVMYTYYALTTLGVRVPWKKMVTIMQIVQFFIDLFVVYFASWNYWAMTKWGLEAYSMGSCAGSETAALSGMGVLSSYLVLFLIFYQNTYKKNKKAAAAAKANGTANGRAVNGKAH